MRVLKISIRVVNQLIKIKVLGEDIFTTAEHPFFVRNDWVKAIDLKIGDTLFLKDKVSARIDEIKIIDTTLVKVYNFTVNNLHNYFVGKNKVLVHNGPCPPSLTPKGGGRRGAFRAAKRADGIPNSEQPLKVGPAKNKAGKVIPGRDYEFKGGKTIREHFFHEYPDDPLQNRGSHFNDSKGNHYDYL